MKFKVSSFKIKFIHDTVRTYIKMPGEKQASKYLHFLLYFIYTERTRKYNDDVWRRTGILEHVLFYTWRENVYRRM